jgi:hypothetical protein
MLESSNKNPIDFDDIARMDKPNIDWVTTLALNDTRIALTNAYLDEQHRLIFVGAVESLIANTMYYWMFDLEFKNKIQQVEEWRGLQLNKIPPGYDVCPDTGLSRLQIDFEACLKKYSLVVLSVIKATKNVPFIDYA